MAGLDFVQELLSCGRVRVPSSLQPPTDLNAAVAELDRLRRANLAFEPPALDCAVGQWALRILFRGCQALVHREIGADAVKDALSEPCPAAPSPRTCYSADLALCYLPDFIRLARGVAHDDPLVQMMLVLAKQWPLSSVGVPGLGEVDVKGFIDHPSLRRLYVDRIIERTDLERLAEPC